jgi:hypothetical protein
VRDDLQLITARGYHRDRDLAAMLDEVWQRAEGDVARTGAGEMSGAARCVKLPGSR